MLLLHGFPQTHACWHRVAPRLASSFTVVAPDLRGYGASSAPPGGPAGEGYTKREMAAELVELMAELGHDRFAVVGHDRGARVAYRLALDHPARVTRVAVIDVVPTLEQFERMGGGPSLGYWPWFLLAQPAPFPERMIAADPGGLLTHVFATWPSTPAAIDDERRAAYLEALTPDTIAAMCADYRASFHPTAATRPTTARRATASSPRCWWWSATTRRSWPTRRRCGPAGRRTSRRPACRAGTSRPRRHPTSCGPPWSTSSRGS